MPHKAPLETQVARKKLPKEVAYNHDEDKYENDDEDDDDYDEEANGNRRNT